MSDDFMRRKYGRDKGYITEYIYRTNRPCTVFYRDENGNEIEKEHMILIGENDNYMEFKSESSLLSIPKNRFIRFEPEA